MVTVTKFDQSPDIRCSNCVHLPAVGMLPILAVARLHAFWPRCCLIWLPHSYSENIRLQGTSQTKPWSLSLYMREAGASHVSLSWQLVCIRPRQQCASKPAPAASSLYQGHGQCPTCHVARVLNQTMRNGREKIDVDSLLSLKTGIEVVFYTIWTYYIVIYKKCLPLYPFTEHLKMQHPRLLTRHGTYVVI